MSIDRLKHSVGQGGNLLWNVDRKITAAKEQVRKNPARAAKKAAQKTLNFAVVEPARIAKDITVHTAKSIYAPLPWAAEGALSAGKSAVQGARQRKIDKKEVADNAWVTAGTRDGVQGHSINVDLIDTLRSGLIGAHANAEALRVRKPTVQVNWAQYAAHIGNMVVVKASKAALVGVAAHAIPGIHGMLLHYLDPVSEDAAFNAVGLTTAASRVGVGAGLLFATHSSFGNSLKKTNLWEYDVEMGNFRKAEQGVRHDLRALETALKAAESLQSAAVRTDPKQPNKLIVDHTDMQALQAGKKVALRLQRELSQGKLEATFPGFKPDSQELTRRADVMLARYGLRGALIPQAIEDLMQPLEDARGAVGLAAANKAAETVQRAKQERKAIPTGLQKMLQKRSLSAQTKRLQSDAKRYGGEADTIRFKHQGVPPAHTADGALFNHLQNKFALANLRADGAQNRLELLALGRQGQSDGRYPTLQNEYQSNLKSIAQLQDDLSTFRALRDHPASELEGGDWRVMRLGYAADFNLNTKAYAKLAGEIEKSRASVAKVSVPLSVKQKTEKRIARLHIEQNIAELNRDQAALNLAVGFKNNRPMPEHSGTPTPATVAAMQMVSVYPTSDKIMRQFLANANSLKQAQASLQTARDIEQRGSDFVQADAAPVAGAPGLINGTLKAAWYSVAVVPVVNLPYWGIKRVAAMLEDNRFKQAIADAIRVAVRRTA